MSTHVHDKTQLELLAARARHLIVRMVAAGRSGHIGGALSSVDIVTTLYFAEMNLDPEQPRWAGRDRFLLSAGHKALAQYAVLSLRGYFELDRLDSYGALGGAFGGHPDLHHVPGVEANTGALGHGLAIACGMAMGLRRDQDHPPRVYVVLGDGELPEGSNWEAAAVASHHRLDNLVAFVDVNDLQISGPTVDVMDMRPIANKFEAFGWHAIEIDGNDVVEILGGLADARESSGRPVVIIASTTKGKGLSEIEGTLASHYWRPTAAQLAQAERDTLDAIAELESVPAVGAR